ncbi:MAG: class I tRNA ligase family protein, partial [Victivallales bacterium]|nr:class I tRNA ligase family protein [Victivallales bacterium]
SQLMILLNDLAKLPKRNRQAIESFILLLSPMAPHIAEELWARLGHTSTLAYEKWPTFDENKMKVSSLEILVQVNGKPKARIMMPADADQNTMQALAKENQSVQQAISGKSIAKAIAVPGRLVNFVVK